MWPQMHPMLRSRGSGSATSREQRMQRSNTEPFFSWTKPISSTIGPVHASRGHGIAFGATRRPSTSLPLAPAHSTYLAAGSRESLAGRFERLTLTHWSAHSFAEAFKLDAEEAAHRIVNMGSYPGTFALRHDPKRWSAYIRDAIIEPAIGRDILALAAVRRPALLRQVFGVAASSPAQIVSLQKIQGQLQDSAALETIAHYLHLLEEAFLVASLPKYSRRTARIRAAPPKLVTLSNAFVAVMNSQPPAPERFGAWVENACLRASRSQFVTLDESVQFGVVRLPAPAPPSSVGT